MNSYTRIWNDLRALYTARNEPESIRPLAELYWRALLSASVAFVAVSLGWGVWTFVDVISKLSSISDTSGTSAPVALDRKQLESTLSAYEARASEFETLKASTTRIADPSR